MRVVLMTLVAVVVALSGCAGTLQREAGSANGQAKLVGASYSKMEIVLTDQARKLQADNPQFNAQELAGYLQRRLDGNGLLRPDAAYRVNVTIDEFRVRSAVSAVLFGLMAGTDSIDGHVQVVDGQGRHLHSFKISASYGLGGWGGGQDGTRMNWLYDKFAELTVGELMGTTNASSVTKTAASTKLVAPAAPIVITTNASVPQNDPRITVVGASAARPMAANQPAPIARTASGFANVDDIDAIPYLGDRGREKYREWLAKPTPRAFAVATDGHFGYAWSLKPSDETLPSDPSERALLGCERLAKQACKLYAVNGAVVWVKDAANASLTSAGSTVRVAQ